MIRDRKWLNFQHELPCLLCGTKDETIVAHHIRVGTYCGTALKPDDNLTFPICYICHEEVNTKGEISTYKKNGFTVPELKDIAIKLYERYKNED